MSVGECVYKRVCPSVGVDESVLRKYVGASKYELVCVYMREHLSMSRCKCE